MTEAFIGEIRLFAGDYAPTGWQLCDGASLSVAEYANLFHVIGTAYGGDGQTSFKLPDLRGRVPLGTGQKPGLSTYNRGQSGGEETVTLQANQMPRHNHLVYAIPNAASRTGTAPGNMLAGFTPSGGAGGRYRPDGSPPQTLAPFSNRAVATYGEGAAHNNVMPGGVVTYIICVDGLLPSGGAA